MQYPLRVHTVKRKNHGDPVANDFTPIFAAADIRAVFTTGRVAAKFYTRLCGSGCICLPSPSPANCAMPFSALAEAYRAILPYLLQPLP